LERLSFGPDAARELGSPLLQGVTVAPLTESTAAGAPFQAAVFRLAPGGRIVRHPAAIPQLLAVLEGGGWVSGGDGGEEAIRAGEAVVWAEGEEHETRTDEGLTALILEGHGLKAKKRE
jgi:quercetin dioxygenase-like cupin family protein